MNRIPTTLGLGGIALVAAVAVAGCGGGSSSAGGGSAYARPASAGTGPVAAKVATRHTKLGTVLVDGRGRTLYLFEKDKRGRSSCYGACATYWPPLLTHGKPTAGARLKGSLLGVTKRADGTSQVTYAGHPLYRFAQDVRSGQVAGQNVDAFGAEWYVLSSSGKKIVKTAPKPTSATGAPSGY